MTDPASLITVAVVAALCAAYAVWTHAVYTMAKRYQLVIIGRALRALRTRGVHRAKAIDLIAPEMRDTVTKRVPL